MRGGGAAPKQTIYSQVFIYSHVFFCAGCLRVSELHALLVPSGVDELVAVFGFGAASGMLFGLNGAWLV